MQEDQEDHAGIISVRRLCSSYVTIWLRGALWGNVKIDGALFFGCQSSSIPIYWTDGFIHSFTHG